MCLLVFVGSSLPAVQSRRPAQLLFAPRFDYSHPDTLTATLTPSDRQTRQRAGRAAQDEAFFFTGGVGVGRSGGGGAFQTGTRGVTPALWVSLNFGSFLIRPN